MFHVEHRIGTDMKKKRKDLPSYYFEDFSGNKKRWKDLTRKEINTLYRFYAKRFNATADDYLGGDFLNSTVDEHIRVIKSQNKVLKNHKISENPRNFKSKAEALRATRQLYSFDKWDYMSEEGKERLANISEEQWRTYQKRKHKFDITREQYEELKFVFNALGSELLEKWGSDAVTEFYLLAQENSSENNILDLMNEIRTASINDKGIFDREGAIDIMRLYLTIGK